MLPRLFPSLAFSSSADQVSKAHPAVAEGIKAVVHEYENGDSLEVLVAHDADKLECLFQAIEYREDGNANMQQFYDSMLAALVTPSAKAIGRHAVESSSQRWHLRT